MNTSLALTALVMGLAGGPHCLAMCGAACAGIAGAAGRKSGTALLGFQAGRLVGYSALGAVAAASVQAIGWLGGQTAVLRPFWTMLHIAALLLGLVLVVRARQPVWLEAPARRVWRRVRSAAGAQGAPVVIGALWAFLPCGLLYSALLVAALAGSAIQGAMVMACFALGSGITLMLGPWLIVKLARCRGRPPAEGVGSGMGSGGGSGAALVRWTSPGAASGSGPGAWGVRLAGATLALSSAWMLMHGTQLASAVAAWCA